MIKIAYLDGVEANLPKSATQSAGAPGTGGLVTSAASARTQGRGAPNHGAARPPNRGTRRIGLKITGNQAIGSQFTG